MTLEQDKEIIQNYHNYLSAKLAEITAAQAKSDLSEEIKDILQKAADGFNHELKWVNFRLESINAQLNPEVVADDVELGVTRTVNSIKQ
jgi:hypothetical protein